MKIEGISPDIAVGIIIEITSILGLVFNGFGFLITLKDPLLKNNFGRLCLNHCIGNFVACLVYFLWDVPITLTHSIPFDRSIYGKIAGQICHYFWEIALYSHVLISIDRLVSIAIPIKHHRLQWFQTRFLMILPWIAAIITGLELFDCKLHTVICKASLDRFCYHVYFPYSWLYLYGNNQCAHYAVRFNNIKNAICLVIMFVLDMVTLYYLKKRHGLQRRRSLTEEIAKQMNYNHRRCETRFFIQESPQTLVQGILYFFALLSINVFMHFLTKKNKLLRFFMVTFQWMAFNTLDGLVMCIFQLTKRPEKWKTVRIFVMSTE